jgi:hypothetical protein
MRWRRLAGLGAISLVLATLLALVAVPFAARMFVRSIVLILKGCVWVAMSLSTGMSVWSVLSVIMRTTVTALSTPSASAILIGLIVIGATAMYLLQRLVGSEGRGSL